MDKEELNNEEVENVEELTGEEGEETTGGAGGLGNVQFVCVCGGEFLSEDSWGRHLHKTHHTSGKVYQQTISRKSSKGRLLGTANVKYEGRNWVVIKYPNGQTQRIGFCS